MQPPFTSDGQKLLANLHAVSQSSPSQNGEKFHVAGVASGLYFVYEQLRNAAEYNEQHLLLRAAIERFLRRSLVFGDDRTLGQELVTELTQARYLKNGSVPLESIRHVDEFVQQYLEVCRSMQHLGIKKDAAFRWTVQVLSVCIEKILVPRPAVDAFVDFACTHYSQAIPKAAFGEVDEQTFQSALYCAVHRSLMKSDIATVRFYMVRRHVSSDDPIGSLVQTCKTVDELFQGSLTNKLARLINRNAAPMRILQQIVVDERSNTLELLANRNNLHKKIRLACTEQYTAVHKRLRQGVWRAVAFIFITKMLVGLGIEIPYDLLVLGHIVMVPLILNFLFPPLYMASVMLSLKVPDKENTDAILTHIDRMLYQTDHVGINYIPRSRTVSANTKLLFNTLYAFAFAVSFGLVVWLLYRLEFTAVHMAIFFAFISAVSFLRFRLLQTSREVEFIERKESFIGVIADFFYTPFIKLGQWLSDRYRRLNVISLIMDIAIELPLKTSLKVLRQWVGFVRDKREGL